jgi:adenylate cyclase
MPILGALRRRAVDVLAAVVAAAGLAVFLAAPAVFQDFEARLYDLHFTLRGPRAPAAPVVIVAVDERSLATVGRWPWSRSVLATLVDRLSAAGVRVIAVDVLLSEAEVSGELRTARWVSDRLARAGLGETAAGRAVQAELERLVRDADADARLEAALKASGRVILPVAFEILPDAVALGRSPPEPSGLPLKSALVAFRHYEERGALPPPAAQGATLPLPRLAAAARGLGHVTMLADPDGSTRWEAVVFEHEGRYYPSLALEAARLALGVEAPDFRLDFGRAVELGERVVPLSARNRLLVDYAGPPGTIPHIPAVDVLEGRIQPEALRDRIVFLGATAEGTYDLRVTPVSQVFPGVEKHANVAANILEGRALRLPGWAGLLEAAAVTLAPFLLAWILPRVRPLAGLAVAAGLVAAALASAHAAFRLGVWLPVFYPILTLATGVVAITGFLYATEERKRLGIKRAFQRFVSPEVVERIAEDPGALQFGGEIRPLTVLFSDIRGFTSYTERHTPQELVQALREYFTRMVQQIHANQGTLDKFIGDAIMAIFGAPLAYPDHAERACRAALAMLAELEKLQAQWTAEGREPFHIGIGINTGEMVVGNLGSEQVFTYTVVGDGVNLASRLESLTKDFGASIVISERTYAAVRHAFAGRYLGEVRVKGKATAVKIYALEREVTSRPRRLATTGRVMVVDGDVAVPGAVMDVSASGAAIHDLPRELPVGRIVHLRIQPAGQAREVALEARVVWSQSGRAGLRFQEVSEEAREALSTVLAALETAGAQPALPESHQEAASAAGAEHAASPHRG